MGVVEEDGDNLLDHGGIIQNHASIRRSRDALRDLRRLLLRCGLCRFGFVSSLRVRSCKSNERQ
jgi:hypothetical protein